MEYGVVRNYTPMLDSGTMAAVSSPLDAVFGPFCTASHPSRDSVPSFLAIP